MASKCVLILDTSILCVWIKIPGMDACGPTSDQWDFARIDTEIQTAIGLGYTLILPLASIIETGNHIAHATSQRRERAADLGELIKKAADETTPWAAFTEQHDLWSAEKLKSLATEWPPLAESKLAMGDVTIKNIAQYYHSMGCDVRLLSGDQHLASYEPPTQALIPRRRQYQ